MPPYGGKTRRFDIIPYGLTPPGSPCLRLAGTGRRGRRPLRRILHLWRVICLQHKSPRRFRRGAALFEVEPLFEIYPGEEVEHRRLDEGETAEGRHLYASFAHSVRDARAGAEKEHRGGHAENALSESGEDDDPRYRSRRAQNEVEED